MVQIRGGIFTEEFVTAAAVRRSGGSRRATPPPTPRAAAAAVAGPEPRTCIFRNFDARRNSMFAFFPLGSAVGALCLGHLAY